MMLEELEKQKLLKKDICSVNCDYLLLHLLSFWLKFLSNSSAILCAIAGPFWVVIVLVVVVKFSTSIKFHFLDTSI